MRSSFFDKEREARIRIFKAQYLILHAALVSASHRWDDWETFVRRWCAAINAGAPVDSIVTKKDYERKHLMGVSRDERA